MLLQKVNGGMGIASTRTSGMFTVHKPSVNLHTPITLLMASHLPCCSNLLISRALNTPSAVPKKHYALLFLIPNRVTNMYLGFILFMGSVEICLANTFSPNGIFQMVFSRRDHSNTWIACCLHLPPTMVRQVSLL